jgi:hypothetical protein
VLAGAVALLTDGSLAQAINLPHLIEDVLTLPPSLLSYAPRKPPWLR